MKNFPNNEPREVFISFGAVVVMLVLIIILAEVIK